MAGHVTHMGDRRGACKVLVGRLGRTRRIWENHTNGRSRNGMGRDGLDWIELAQYRDNWRTLVFVLMNFRVQKTRGIL